MNLDENCEVDVFVTSVDSPSLFFVHLVDSVSKYVCMCKYYMEVLSESNLEKMAAFKLNIDLTNVICTQFRAYNGWGNHTFSWTSAKFLILLD